MYHRSLVCMSQKQNGLTVALAIRITESIFTASKTRKSFSTELALLKAFHATARRASLSESWDIAWQIFMRPVTAVKRTRQLQTSEQQKHAVVNTELLPYWQYSHSMRQGICNITMSVCLSVRLSHAVDHCSSMQWVCSCGTDGQERYW